MAVQLEHDGEAVVATTAPDTSISSVERTPVEQTE
jgi:hypothetical protein